MHTTTETLKHLIMTQLTFNLFSDLEANGETMSMGILSEKEIDKIISKATSKYIEESIKAYGNAIVNQVAIQIFTAINEFMEKISENNC